MKKQKRGIVPESHWTEHLIAVGIAIVVVLLVVMFTSCTTVQREKIIDLIDG
jgi:DMSO/TMAO reductase YedYZ heme-binding membrane subunit